MAKKKTTGKKVGKKKQRRSGVEAVPKHPQGVGPVFPYCTTLTALRRFMSEVSKKPNPGRVNMDLLRGWGIGDSNANSIIRVLKTIGMVSSSNETTDGYVSFMDQTNGPAWLAGQLRETYKKLFDTSHEPYNEPNDLLKNMFNIHSGGSASTIDYQVQTFKALCDFANFSAASPVITGAVSGGSQGAGVAQVPASAAASAAVHIDLHIHLPPNKSARDYEAMFQDIGRYIYGRGEVVD